jgi:putative iron-regulated protein
MKPTRLSLLMWGTALFAAPAMAADPAGVVATYADIAAATYDDSLTTARALKDAVEALIDAPSEVTLAAARAAWIASREPYQQTEVFRFGNPIVDDWEGRVNAWPLDEGLIDYVAESYGGPSDENELAALNVIATPKFTLGGTEVDASMITPDLISGTLQEADGIEANVASGYHAIEFLLWGQDLNGTGPGAGERPFTDFVVGAGCTGGNCDRRVQYLASATDLLVRDLEEMQANWVEGGAARAAVTGDPSAGLTAMLTGMGALAYGEMAGDRMKLGLLLNDPEEEHDCFSDNTYNSHYYDGLGMQNVYLGRYTRLDGSEVRGPALSELVAVADPALDAQLRGDLEATMAALAAIKAKAESGMAYDQMLAAGNAEGAALINAGIDALITQTTSVERAVTALGLSGISFEPAGDGATTVFQ